MFCKCTHENITVISKHFLYKLNNIEFNIENTNVLNKSIINLIMTIYLVIVNRWFR